MMKKKLATLAGGAVIAAAAFTAGPIALSTVAQSSAPAPVRAAASVVSDATLPTAEAGGYCKWVYRYVVFGKNRWGVPFGGWVLQRVWIDVGGPGGPKKC